MTKAQTTKTASNNGNIWTWIDTLTTKRETWVLQLNGTLQRSNIIPTTKMVIMFTGSVDLSLNRF